MPQIENSGATRGEVHPPWRCAACRHDATGLILGMPCPECGRPLDRTSIRPTWLEPRILHRLRLAARLAFAATFALALFPPVVLGLRAQGFAVPPSIVIPVLLIVTAAAVAAQTFAILRLLWSATCPARTRWSVVAVLLRAPLLFIFAAGSFGFLSATQQSGTIVAPWKGFLAGGAGVPGGTMQWLSALLMQALVAMPILVQDFIVAAKCGTIANSISDDRPVWGRIQKALALISWWFAFVGMLSIAIPLTGWFMTPLAWLAGHLAFFRTIDRMLGLHIHGGTAHTGNA